MTESRRIKETLLKLRLSESERDKIWRNIEKEMPKRKRSSQNFGHGFEESFGIRKRRTVLKAAVVAGVVLIGGLWIANIVTDGKLAEAMTSIWDISKESREIIKASTDVHVRIDSVYAPELIEYSDDRIIFGGSFGLLVYDRKEKRVVGTLNLEEIGCNFFNADTLTTHFFVEGDQLFVYNLKIPAEVRVEASLGNKLDDTKLKAEERCYVYDLSVCDRIGEKRVVQLKPDQITENGKDVEKRWQEKVHDIRKDTFQSFEDVEVQFEDRSYSEYCLLCEDEETGEAEYVALVLGGTGKNEQGTKTGYSIWAYRQNVKTKALKKEKLEIEVSYGVEPEPTGEQTEVTERLPEYEYRGKDEIKKALTDCFKNDPMTYEGIYYGSDGTRINVSVGDCDVMVPLIRIAGVKEEGKVAKVFGTFRWAGFTLQGKTLYEAGAEVGQTSGGSEAVAYLRKKASGYEVEKIVMPRDGALLWKDMMKLADGDENLVKKVYSSDYMKLAEKTLRQYVKNNHLDIKHYKPFGWDPVDISEETP